MNYKECKNELPNDFTEDNDLPVNENLSFYMNELENYQTDRELLIILQTILNFIESNKYISTSLPIATEFLFFNLISANKDKTILHKLFQITNFFLQKNPINIQRFLITNLYQCLIKTLLQNDFDVVYSAEMVICLMTLIDALFMSNNNPEYINNFFQAYPIESFLNAKVDIVDKISILIIFSKYCYDENEAIYILKFLKKVSGVIQFQDQLSSIMLYLSMTNIDNTFLLFSLPDAPEFSFFEKISEFFLNVQISELFLIRYLKLCAFILENNADEAIRNSILSKEIENKMVTFHDLASFPVQTKVYFLKYLEVLIELDYEKNFKPNQDIILPALLNSVNNTEVSYSIRLSSFLVKLIPYIDLDAIKEIYDSDFFVCFLEVVNSSDDIIIASKLIFLIFECLEQSPQYFNEYISILIDNEVLGSYHQMLESNNFEPQLAENLQLYHDKLNAAIEDYLS